MRCDVPLSVRALLTRLRNEYARLSAAPERQPGRDQRRYQAWLDLSRFVDRHPELLK